MVVAIDRSKTDQEGGGRAIGIPYGSQLPTFPVRALDAWMQAARISSGPGVPASTATSNSTPLTGAACQPWR